MPRLFGTDGVRGKAGEYPLDHETVARLGAALVRAMRADSTPAAARRSASSSAATRANPATGSSASSARGVHAEGAAITTAGVIPTPAIAYVTRAMGFDAGLVISASHNPFEDNGIKVFSGRGEKFTEALERQVEAIVADRELAGAGGGLPPVDRTDVVDAYIAHARAGAARPGRLGGFKLAIDTANGATTTVAPRLFRELGLRRHRHRQRAGRPQHQPRLRLDASGAPGRARCASSGHRMGVAFDGDGDRAIFVDDDGRDRRRRRRDADVRAPHAGAGPPRRQRGRRDRHEQHRPRDRAARLAASSWSAARSATST